MLQLKANALMKRNIDEMLRARGHSRHDLARWCHRTDPWLTKIMNVESREFPMKYFDRIADFFGISVYQLFIPGITTLTERRRGLERRSGVDRRIGRSGNVRPPITAETLSPREVELLRLAEGLKTRQFDEMVHWAQAQLVRQGLEPGGVLRVDPRPRGVEGPKPRRRKPTKKTTTERADDDQA